MTRTIAALDVGSTKICCFIAEHKEGERLRVTGIGHQQSAGLKNGVVVDMATAYRAILSTVTSAEQMAGKKIEHVILSMNAGRPASRLVTSSLSIGGGAIRDPDINRVLHAARDGATSEDQRLLHAIPIGYSVDNGPLLRDPRGMHAQSLSIQMHLLTARETAIQNLVNCVARCHLEISDYAFSPYAAGLAALVEDERDLGATIIDMGGGTTSVCVFYEGAAIYGDSIPVGGNHVTSDIARGLAVTLTQAERMKTVQGSCIPATSDDKELIETPRLGEEDELSSNHVPKSHLVGIITPRLEETFELVRTCLEESGVSGMVGQRVVLTGGASQLPGVREMAHRILEKQIRHGRPLKINGLAERTGGPVFATAAGLLHFAADDQGEARGVESKRSAPHGGLLIRLGEWFRDF